MSMWKLVTTDTYERELRWYEKKRRNELLAVIVNLDTYFETLQRVEKPLLVRAGFIHTEQKGVIALDQKGGRKKTKFQQTRLYLYPSEKEKVVYLLTIGDKKRQRSDVKDCGDFVADLRRKERT